MQKQFIRMTDLEIAQYVFEPTSDYSIISPIIQKYVKFCVEVGKDMPDALKFFKGNVSNYQRDETVGTIKINAPKYDGKNIVTVANNAIMQSIENEIKASLKKRNEQDVCNHKLELSWIKQNKKLNKKERWEARREAKKREKFCKKYGYYEDEYVEENYAPIACEDYSDIIEQETEDAARQAMYMQYEQILKAKPTAHSGQATPSKPPLIAVHKGTGSDIDMILPTTQDLKATEKIIYNEDNLKEILVRDKEV